jgi:hypothetical protein
MLLPRERTLAAADKIRNDCIGSRKVDARPELHLGGSWPCASGLAGVGGISVTPSKPTDSTADEVRQSSQSKEDDKEHKADGADYANDSFVFQYTTGPCRALPDTYSIRTAHEHLSAPCRSKTFARPRVTMLPNLGRAQA